LWRYENAFDSRPTNPTFTTTICTIAKFRSVFGWNKNLEKKWVTRLGWPIDCRKGGALKDEHHANNMTATK